MKDAWFDESDSGAEEEESDISDLINDDDDSDYLPHSSDDNSDEMLIGEPNSMYRVQLQVEHHHYLPPRQEQQLQINEQEQQPELVRRHNSYPQEYELLFRALCFIVLPTHLFALKIVFLILLVVVLWEVTKIVICSHWGFLALLIAFWQWRGCRNRTGNRRNF